MKNNSSISSGELFCGDNLEFMNTLPEGSIDFIYIDPPFFSGREYKQGDNSFEDRWKGGIDTYISWLAKRLEEMHCLLKKTGVLAVHLDWHAVHYIKVELDRIFGQGNKSAGGKRFINEIFWKRRNGSANLNGCHHLSRNADQILVYSKSKEYFFGNNFIDDSKNPSEKILKMYCKDDHDGKGLYRWITLQNPDDRPNLKYKFHGVNPPKKGWMWTKERMEKAWAEGRVKIFGQGDKKTMRQKKYLSERKGMPIATIWDDLPGVMGVANESVGYPTQKPVALLERLIKIFTKEGDLIADFFCGSGTTLVAAQNLNRRFIGSDINPQAIEICQSRLFPNEVLRRCI